MGDVVDLAAARRQRGDRCVSAAREVISDLEERRDRFRLQRAELLQALAEVDGRLSEVESWMRWWDER